MEISRLNDDSMIWRNRGATNPELQKLFQEITSFDPGVTYEVRTEKAYKSLKSSILRQFAGTKRINVKPKDQTWIHWYIRVDSRPPKPKNAKKQTMSRRTKAAMMINSIEQNSDQMPKS